MQKDRQEGRIPVERRLRDKLQAEKRGEENWSDLLRRIYDEWKQSKKVGYDSNE